MNSHVETINEVKDRKSHILNESIEYGSLKDSGVFHLK